MGGGVVFSDIVLNLLFCAAVVGAAVVPLLWAVRLERRRINDPGFLREVGIVVIAESALDGVSEVVGRYMGAQIYRDITFHGVRYVYDRIVPPAYKRFVTSSELYVEPGIVYVAT
jgi:hypothetical protein